MQSNFWSTQKIWTGTKLFATCKGQGKSSSGRKARPRIGAFLYKNSSDHGLVHLQFFITQIKLWNDYVPAWFYLIVIDFLAVRLTVVKL